MSKTYCEIDKKSPIKATKWWEAGLYFATAMPYVIQRHKDRGLLSKQSIF